MIESDLDLFLGGHELIEGAIPGLQLPEVDPDSLVPVPVYAVNPFSVIEKKS